MTLSLNDLYGALGLKPGASLQEIKTAYRNRAREFHPDIAGNDPRMAEMFQHVKLAYEILNDPEKREAFESSVEAAHINRAMSDLARRAGKRVGRAIIAWRRRKADNQRNARAGADLLYRIDVPLADLAADSFRMLLVERPGPCPECNGRGKLDHHGPCPDCRGQGKVRRVSHGETTETDCKTCKGTGSPESLLCMKCRGMGTAAVTEQVPVKIPAGIAHGTRLKIRGMGERSEVPGDLYVEVRQLPDQRFRRAGLDIFSTQKIPFTRALAGGEVEVETVQGPYSLELSKGMASGASFRLKRMGLPDPAGGDRGDHIVNLVYKIPDLTDEQIEQLLRWERLEATS